MDKMTDSEKYEYYAELVEKHGWEKVVKFLVACIPNYLKPHPDELQGAHQ